LYTGGDDVGGIAGYFEGYGSIETSYNIGDVTGGNNIGRHHRLCHVRRFDDAVLLECRLIRARRPDIGGITGYNASGLIQYCYTRRNISGLNNAGRHRG
jgi:hypothetical protein